MPLRVAGDKTDGMAEEGMVMENKTAGGGHNGGDDDTRPVLDRDVFYRKEDLTSDYFQSITRSRHPLWCRLIWGIIIVASFAFTVYMVYNLLDGYLEFNSFNQDSMVWQNGVALPALTICNVNVVNFTAWSEQSWSAEELEGELNWFIKDVTMEMKTSSDDGSFIKLSEEDIKRAKKLDKVTLENGETVSIYDLHSKFEKYFLGDGASHPYMEFAYRYKDPPSSDNYINTKLGQCLVLNDDQAMVQKLGGVLGGLTIDLDTREFEYLYATESAGFMLYLRNPHEIVISDIGGIYLAPGFKHFISLERNDITRLQTPYGTCEDQKSVFNTSRYQTMRECIQSLYIEETVKTCGCIPWYVTDTLETYLSEDGDAFETWLRTQGLPEETSMDEIETFACSFVDQTICDLNVIDILSNMDISKVCRESCKYKEWDYSLNFGQFPPFMGYFSTFISPYVNRDGYEKSGPVGAGFDMDTDPNTDTDTETDPNTDTDTETDPNTDTDTDTETDTALDDQAFYTYAQKNFVRIHVYYDDVKLTKVVQTKAYELSNFIAEFGGATDLLMGLSFFTVFQLFEILVVYVIFRCCPKRK